MQSKSNMLKVKHGQKLSCSHTCHHHPCCSFTWILLHRYGAFFEEINHSGEGGLNPELLRDRSFEARAYLANK